MTKKARHVLGISGGKDSAALAVYMKDNYPEIDIEYYCCDTGKELQETYELIEKLEVYLGKKIIRLKAAGDSSQDPFDHHYHVFGDYLPSSSIRWCTKYLKLHPFEAFVGDDLVVSYVGIRDDEDREGYISKKSNIQSIFPFRKNIWSEDVIQRVTNNNSIASLLEICNYHRMNVVQRFLDIVSTPLSKTFSEKQKITTLLNIDTIATNFLIFNFLKITNLPLSYELSYPLINNTDFLNRDDIFSILRHSGVGVPSYYEKIKFELDGTTGEYARSRSGCYFCFFQQKIEWVWLYEQHVELFNKAIEYENEKEGFTWNQNESLTALIQPERIRSIKQEFLNRKQSVAKSDYLIDILENSETEGCAACFI